MLVPQQKMVCVWGVAVFQQKRTCARLPCSVGAGQNCAACRQPLLEQAAQGTPCAVGTAAGLGDWCQLSRGRHQPTPGTFTFFRLSRKEGASNRSLMQVSKTILFKTFCNFKAAIVRYIYFPRRFVWKYCVPAAVSQVTLDLGRVKYRCLAKKVLKTNGGFWIFC